jgi:SAM-dependent methyltransferase
MTSPQEAELDIRRLIAELREEAEKIRAQLGPSTLPLPVSRAEVLERLVEGDPPGSASGLSAGSSGELAAAAGHLATMRALYDPRGVDLHSHRATLGFAVIAAKRLLGRLLTPFFDRQAAFNRAVLQSFSAFEIALRAQEKACRKLERQIGALERNQAEAPGAADAMVGSFDYFDFESTFRGDSARVRRSLERYLVYFPGPESGPVLDLGCGRGEFLALLRARGIPASGVDRDPEMVARCREQKLEARHDDLLRALDGLPDASLGGVVAFQVVEHLPLEKLIELLALAKRKLRPAGCLIAETINPQSLITFARAWSIDPTHRHPVHPLTLRFLVDAQGFSRSEIVYSGEVEPALRLEGEGADDVAARNAVRLNSLLFAPQDYAVVAWA